VQEWHSPRDTVRKKLYVEPGKDGRSEQTSGEFGRQHWNKGSRPKEAAASRKREDIQRDLQEDFRAADRKANSRIFYQTWKSKGMDIVEGSAPSETEKEIAHAIGAGNMVVPATLGSFAPNVKKKTENRMMVENRKRLAL
jgi:hypothetical protein